MNYRILVKCFIVISTLFAFIGCNEVTQQEKFLPESTGSVNQVIVVTTDTIWKGAVGDSIRKYFAAPLEASTIAEPEFTLTYLPQPIWKGAITKSRNVLYILTDTLEAAHIKKNLYARPQNIAVVKSKDLENLKNNLFKVAATAKYNFRETELELAQARFLKSLSSKALFDERLGFSLRLPSIYQLGVDQDGFLWYDRPVEGGTINLMAYSLEKGYFADRDSFVDQILGLRDSIGKKYVPGPDVPGAVTYMISERTFAPYVRPTEVGGFKAVEVKGIWEVQNYPMAGPYLMYLVNDTINKRTIVLEGFTFAPSKPKRDFMFELEAIMKSIEITE